MFLRYQSFRNDIKLISSTLKSETWPIFLPVKLFSKYLNKNCFQSQRKIFQKLPTATKRILIKIQ
jgi:hypothetical protein